jgi:hypothetical protein
MIFLLIFMTIFTVSIEMIINERVCGHWVTAAIVAGLMKWSDIILYIQHSTFLCSMPMLNYIQCCNPDFNITSPIGDSAGSGLVLPNAVHNPVCGLASIGSCQLLFYSEDLEYLNISAGEMIFGTTGNENVALDNWTIVGICGLCGLALALLAYLCLEVYKTCCQDTCCNDTGISSTHYSPIK